VCWVRRNMSRRLRLSLGLALAVATSGCGEVAGHLAGSALPRPSGQTAGFYILLGVVILSCYGISKATD
jgi:hypothetical protein